MILNAEGEDPRPIHVARLMRTTQENKKTGQPELIDIYLNYKDLTAVINKLGENPGEWWFSAGLAPIPFSAIQGGLDEKPSGD